MENVLGVVSLAEGVSPVQGLGIEFFLALILVLVVCGACDAAKPESKGIAPLIIGLAVTVGHLVGVRTIFTFFNIIFKFIMFDVISFFFFEIILGSKNRIRNESCAFPRQFRRHGSIWQSLALLGWTNSWWYGRWTSLHSRNWTCQRAGIT